MTTPLLPDLRILASYANDSADYVTGTLTPTQELLDYIDELKSTLYGPDIVHALRTAWYTDVTFISTINADVRIFDAILDTI